MTMTPHMDDPTLAEVYRAVLRIEQLQIRTNGRVSNLELAEVRIDERLTVIERTHSSCPLLRPDGVQTRLSGITQDSPDVRTPLASLANPKQIAFAIAVVAGAVWVAVDLLWKMGDWLHRLGLR